MQSLTPGLSVGDILKIAVRHHNNGRTHEAENLYRAILRVQPHNPDANHNLGVIAVQMNQIEKGLPHFKTALEANPRCGQYWLSYIDALILSGNLQAAAQVLEQGKAKGLQKAVVEKLTDRLDKTVALVSDKAKDMTAYKGSTATPGEHSAGDKLFRRDSAPATSDLDASASPEQLMPTQAGHTQANKTKALEDAASQHPAPEEIRSVLHLFHAGNHEAALVAAKTLTQTYPEHHFGYKYAAVILATRGKPREALRYAQKAASLLQEPASLNVYGAILKSLGKMEEALQTYDTAIQLKPDFADAYYNKGIALQDMGRLEEALQAYSKALEIKPDYAAAYNNTGIILQELNRMKEALQAYDNALEIKPDFCDAHNNKGNTLMILGRFDEALAAFNKALEINQYFNEAYIKKGNTLTIMGQTDEALVQYNKALANNPDLVGSLNGIASIDSSRLNEANLQTLAKIATSHDIAPDDKITACFALGRVLEQRKEYDQAFGWFATGNRYRQATSGRQRYNHQHKHKLLQRYVKMVQPALFADNDLAGSFSTRPVFVVGFPRSGTTLVEQILASHSKVYGAGELPYLNELAKPLTKHISSENTQVQNILSENMLQEMAQDYLSRLEVLAGDCERVVDKMPHNFEHLWLISLLFPQATVIHCRRNPVDTCLSCFFQDFTTGHHYADNLVSLGQHYCYYNELMDHWKRTLPIFMHEVIYEEFTTDHERQIPALLEACGLDFEPGCLEFHRTKRAVQTASTTQVRQKIYTSSVEKWKNYAAHLEPLLQELDCVLPASR